MVFWKMMLPDLSTVRMTRFGNKLDKEYWIMMLVVNIEEM
jgi:hypothetical protein